MVEITDVIDSLDLGASVAEQDTNLSSYFVNSRSMKSILTKKDILLGVKGSGKTAIFKQITKNNNYSETRNVLFVDANRLNADSDFKSAFEMMSQDDNNQNQFVQAWKIYLINAVWPKIKALKKTESYNALYYRVNNDKLLVDLKYPSLFDKLRFAVKRIKIAFSSDIQGNRSMEAAVDLNSGNELNRVKPTSDLNSVDFNEIFRLIDAVLQENGKRLWIMFDRLDDAFPHEKDQFYIRQLLIAYKDFYSYDNFKLKISLRDDIFQTITGEKYGFEGLSHVSEKATTPILWDKTKFKDLIIKRLKLSAQFKSYLNKKNISISDPKDWDAVLEVFLGKQVDNGSKNPDALGWIINHIKDGQSTATPRDVITLLNQALDMQRDEAIPNNQEPIISSSKIKSAYEWTSNNKLNTQLYAEYPDYRSIIELFRARKSTYKEKVIEQLLGENYEERLKQLQFVGFIGKFGDNWKVPFIYRPALEIKTGEVVKL